MSQPLWPHQERGIQQVIAGIEAGETGLCVTSPTGGGKSKMMVELIRWAKETGRRTTLYTNRRLLLEQLQWTLAGAGIMHGLRASGFRPRPEMNVQLASIQTEDSRVYKQKTHQLSEAELVIIDEAHVNSAGVCQKIVAEHKAQGAAVVGFTATPVDLAHLYQRLIVAGTNSELRSCGAHVPCHTYGPDEPDMRLLPKEKVLAGVDFSEGEIRKAIMVPQIFGRVLDGYRMFNPEQRPAILFAPGVAESMWFAEQFRAAGISAAHIDGGFISYGETDADGNSVTVKSTREERKKILEGSKSGEIKVLCNRFVLREGIDAPWIYHGIMATIFGSLASYLQAGGRLLRSHSSLDHVVMQDHGGNWWRHGSLNSDRQWDLTWTNRIISGERITQMREKKVAEPIVCTKCFRVRMSGMKCPFCAFEITKRSRMVAQRDGTLIEMSGEIIKPRRVARKHNTEEIWRKVYSRARSKKWNATFLQAEALFYRENHYWPPRDLPLMPKHGNDWYAKVTEVPKHLLN